MTEGGRTLDVKAEGRASGRLMGKTEAASLPSQASLTSGLACLLLTEAVSTRVAGEEGEEEAGLHSPSASERQKLGLGLCAQNWAGTDGRPKERVGSCVKAKQQLTPRPRSVSPTDGCFP